EIIPSTNDERTESETEVAKTKKSEKEKSDGVEELSDEELHTKDEAHNDEYVHDDDEKDDDADQEMNDDENDDEVKDDQLIDDAEKVDSNKTEEKKGDIEQDGIAKDGQVGAQISDNQKEKPEVPPSSSSLSLSLNYGNQFLNISSDTSLVGIIKQLRDTEINSLLDVQIQQEIPFVLSTPLLDVLVSTIPPQLTPTPTFTTPTPLSTPLPTPLISSVAPTIATTVLDLLPPIRPREEEVKEREFELSKDNVQTGSSKIDKLTKADLVGHVHKLLKGTCKSSIELEYNMDQCHLTIPVDFFFNNNLEYLKTGNSERKYTLSITKTKATRVSKHGVLSTMNIMSVISIKVDKRYGYGYLEEIVVRRADQKLYTFKEELPKKLNVTPRQKEFPVISAKELYTTSYDPHGIVYLNSREHKKLMRANELYKFSDITLKSVHEILHYRLLNLKLERRIMRNLERLVGARELETDYRLMLWMKLNFKSIDIQNIKRFDIFGTGSVEVNLCGLLGLGKSDLNGENIKYRCARTELITLDLECLSTHQLLWNSDGDSGPGLSFDKSASPERLFSLAHVPFSFPLTFSITAKKDMDLYHSRLTPDDLNDLIIKYKIPRDLHPWLPLEDFVMSELLDNAMGIYHRMFDFSGIEPTVTLFRVFQTLCKQGGWFSFAKRRAPSPVYAMVWRHPDIVIDDPRLAAGSFNMADVCRLIMGIYDFLCLLEWTGAEVQEEPHLDVRSTLQTLPFYCTPPAMADKRKAFTSSATSSHVAKRTRSALAQSFGSTTRPSLFVGDDDESDDDDDDAYVEIPLGTPLRSAGKGVMVDDATAPSASASRPRLSSRPAPSFRNVFGDAIHTDFFPFSAGPYYATYPKDGVAGNCEFTQEEWDAPNWPTFGVMTKEVFKDPAVCKTIEEKVASLTGLEHQVSALKKQVSSLNDKLSSSNASFAKSKEKGKERKKKIRSLTKSVDNFHSKVAHLSTALNQATFLASDEFSRVQGELLSLASSAGFERGLSMHRNKDEFADVLKNMANFMPGAHDRLAESSPFLNKTSFLKFFNFNTSSLQEGRAVSVYQNYDYQDYLDDRVEFQRISLTWFRSCTSRSHYRSVSKQTTRYPCKDSHGHKIEN
ncbi:hypothetical protein Tco_0588808, partial [Tanacetum coccineum]